ncbi:hypothetical protein [Nocardia sp. NPDC005366]|uniref:Rv1733c family protein n=1 Tax=Nocardia sp. NPDC005366 TaxID=3156878 RepID=UPI0033B4C562
MRPSDRVESVLRIVVVLAGVVAVPLSCAIGTQVYSSNAAQIRTEHATKSAVVATITAAPTDRGRHSEATVSWTDAGQTRTATLDVPRSATLGEHVTVWLEPDGKLTSTPREPEAAALSGIGAATVLLVGVWVSGWLLVHGATGLLTRRRLARWDRDQLAFGGRITEDRQ